MKKAILFSVIIILSMSQFIGCASTKSNTVSVVKNDNVPVTKTKETKKIENVDKLKKQLLDIKNNNCSIPSSTNKYELALEMLENIGTTDPELRDDLILNLLSDMILGNDLTDKDVKNLLELSLSEKHLFCNIGKIEDDSVFNRSFTLLIIKAILCRHNEFERKLFTQKEIQNIYNEIIRYARKEKDTRGYVANKGWAHSTAHTADIFEEIAQFSEINKPELLEILNVIKEKVCINYYTYTNSEDERLVCAVIKILQKGVLNDKEFTNWIKSFEDLQQIGKYPEDHNLISNHKNFLSALYFRLKRNNGQKVFIDTIEEVLNTTTPSYFQ